MKNKILFTSLALLAMILGLYIQNKFTYDFATLDGSKIHQSDLNEKWVVVNYFAEWCAPCLREIPELNKLQKLTKDDNVLVFGVSFDNLQEANLEQLRDKYNIEYPLITDIKQSFPFSVPQYLPATFLLRPDGSVAGQLLGEQHADTLIAAIEHEKLSFSD